MKPSTLLLAAALALGSATAVAQAPAPSPGPSPAPAPAPRVALDTTQGRIVIELAPQQAPKTVENFLAYVKAGHYDGTVFHRIIPTFMIQAGGFTADMKERATRPPIPLESQNGLKNVRGAVSMARRPDPNSATSQFFINVADNPRLDYPSPDGNGYAVFGKVVEGMDVVDKIKDTPTESRGPHQNVPVTPVTIKSARVVK
jgi:peptidyl-prolyl cis-trans isomerase A (cyclophilin A)